MDAPTTKPEILRAMAFAMRAAEVMLSAAVSVGEVEDAARRAVRAVGLPSCEVSVTLNTITLSYLPPDLADTFTLVRVVDGHATRLDRLTDAHDVLHRLERGDLDVGGAYDELEAISRSPDRYGWRLRFAAGLVMAVAWVVSTGGGPASALVGLAIGALAVPLYEAVLRSRVPDLFGAVAGGFVVAGLPWLASSAGLPVSIVAATAGGLYPLLPGGALIASVRDGLSGAPISATAKGLQAVVSAVGLALGVLGALAVVEEVAPTVTDAEAAVGDPVRALGVALALAGLAVVRQLPRRLIGPMVGIGMAAWLLVWVAPSQGVGRELAIFAGGIVVGLGGLVVARWQHAVASAYIGISVLVLAPGLRIYGAMLAFAQGDSSAGGDIAIDALRLALAAAAGVALGVAVSLPSLRLPRAPMLRRP